jgi:hypothetical protein
VLPPVVPSVLEVVTALLAELALPVLLVLSVPVVQKAASASPPVLPPVVPSVLEVVTALLAELALPVFLVLPVHLFQKAAPVSPAVLLPVVLSVLQVAPVLSPEPVLLVSAAVCVQEAALASLVRVVQKVLTAL